MTFPTQIDTETERKNIVSLSPLFTAMVKKGTPSWNYFFGASKYSKYDRFGTVGKDGANSHKNIKLQLCLVNNKMSRTISILAKN